MTVAAVVLAVTVLLAAGFLFLNRSRRIVFDGKLPDDFPASGFPQAAFEELLRRYVDVDGDVDYAGWRACAGDVARLDDYLAAVAGFSPDSAPQRFDSSADSLAYWLYAYNAYVIRSVLQHWPIASVTDVRAPIEAVTGLGFFYRQRFLFGGEYLSLYAVEHDKILAAFCDPRIHFVLNCASGGCPVLRPELPTGAALEPFLDESARNFINDPRNVRIDHDRHRILLNRIFRWYRKDFVNDLRRCGIAAERGVLDYIYRAAGPGLRDELDRARNYEVVYGDYDWRLNARAGR